MVIDNKDDPWWVAKEGCKVLGIQNHFNVIAKLDDDEKGLHILETLGGPQEFRIVNESGLYSLILRSKKPEAKRLKRWATHDVLPAIRKTGGCIHGAEKMDNDEPCRSPRGLTGRIVLNRLIKTLMM